jgi:N-acetylmuramoyl-L-alanine amidase
MLQIMNHRLGAPAIWKESPNTGGKFRAGKADTIVLHYTAGRSAESSAGTLSRQGSGVSAHLVVGRNGELYQLVPFDTIAWHAGASAWNGRTGLNKYSIGIEMDNAGHLTRTGDGNFVSWFGAPYPASDAVEGVHRNGGGSKFWHRYSPEQIELVEELCSLLIQHYGITTIVGHEEIAPGRKTDPGPAFPLDKLRNRLLLDPRSSDEGLPEAEEPAAPPPAVVLGGRVTASKLNVRRDPALTAPAVAAPLARGTVVTILEELQGWTRIGRPAAGWVKSDYLELVT